jgi:hypothetical protein
MNRAVLACAIASVVLAGPLSFQQGMVAKNQETSVTGVVSPSANATSVSIVGKSSTITVNLVAGRFFAKVKRGRYKLIVHTNGKNRVAQLDNVEVKKNQALDIGEIMIQ